MSAGPTSSLPAQALSRRKIMLATACAAIALTAGRGGGRGNSMASTATAPPLVDSFSAAGARPALSVVAEDAGTLDGSGTREFSLRVETGTTQSLDGPTSVTRGYDGAVLGPALRLRTGEKVTLRVRNDLDEPTTVHWHGILEPAECHTKVGAEAIPWLTGWAVRTTPPAEPRGGRMKRRQFACETGP